MKSSTITLNYWRQTAGSGVYIFDIMTELTMLLNYQERAKASQGKGKLGKQLDAQRSQTQSDTLKQNARDNIAARDADAGAQTRQYN